MSNKSLVSIVMPAYNSAKLIEETIRSVVNQDFEFWELIIINDGSTDNTEDVVNKFASDSRIILISQENQGVAAARNQGIKKSRGEYIAFLDADDIWKRDKLSKQLAYFETNQNIDLIYTGNFIFEGMIQNSSLNNYIEPFTVDTDYFRLLISDFIVTSSVMLKRTILKNNICFDQSFIGTEDWDFWIRLSKDNNFGYIPEPLLYYREHSAGISKNLERQYHNDYLVRLKHVFNNEDIPKNVKVFSAWMLMKKKIFLTYKSKSKIKTALQYLNMVVKFPTVAETYKFPFKFLLKHNVN